MNLLTNVAGSGRAQKILKSEGAGMSDQKLQALLILVTVVFVI